jgi:hypothetical protein
MVPFNGPHHAKVSLSPVENGPPDHLPFSVPGGVLLCSLYLLLEPYGDQHISKCEVAVTYCIIAAIICLALAHAEQCARGQVSLIWRSYMMVP